MVKRKIAICMKGSGAGTLGGGGGGRGIPVGLIVEYDKGLD